MRRVLLAGTLLSILIFGQGMVLHRRVRTYTTTFAATENPISESSSWRSGLAIGLDWTDVATTGGYAYGRQTSSSGTYSDAGAVLVGRCGPVQTATATVRIINQDSHPDVEVELRLLSTVGAHSFNGYELFMVNRHNNDGYAQIVRWNGPVSNFTYLRDNRYGGAGGWDPGGGVAIGEYVNLHDGDVLKATVTVAGVLTLSHAYAATPTDFHVVATATDTTFRSGCPGIGFYNSGEGSIVTDVSFSDFSAECSR